MSPIIIDLMSVEPWRKIEEKTRRGRTGFYQGHDPWRGKYSVCDATLQLQLERPKDSLRMLLDDPNQHRLEIQIIRVLTHNQPTKQTISTSHPFDGK